MRALLARFALELAVFVCGALVMVYEIIGSRIVAPYIGTSTYIWTSLIGVILAALSLGYWLGGRMADRRPDVKVLAAAIFIAGGLVSLTVLIKDAILSAIHAAGGPLELKSVAAAALLFAPASVLLGFVTPYAVKLSTISLADSGKTVGRLYALSTVGSIAGTFAAGFFLIPFVGSTRTLYLIAGSLFAVSLLLAPFALTRTNITILTLFVFGVASTEFMTYYLRTAHNLIDLDTEYSRVQIYETTHPETGRKYRAIATDPYFAQSAMYLDDGSPVFEYVKFFKLVESGSPPVLGGVDAALPSLSEEGWPKAGVVPDGVVKPDNKKILMIGGAGYTIPKEYLRDHPNSQIDVVEIDSQMTQLARRHFGLRDDPRLTIFHEDGRVFLNQAPANTYDAVLIDAFGSLFSIPFQLTTIEAIQQIHRVLKDDGIVIVNIGSALTGPASLFLQAEFASYRHIFPEVQVFKVNTHYSDEKLQNLIVKACKTVCLADFQKHEVTKLFLNIDNRERLISLPPLTDDVGPVEYYSSQALRFHRQAK